MEDFLEKLVEYLAAKAKHDSRPDDNDYYAHLESLNDINWHVAKCRQAFFNVFSEGNGR